jgi:NADH-quinone oxidoreductase subunit L
MVAAGVFLVARSYFLFETSPIALSVVAYTGIFTAFFAASMALVANDIKRVLAFSTVSQLGYMMMALGVGGYTAGMFHLTTHAFFKALLFLGAGSVIHGAATQDIREMGGLGKYMKITAVTFLIASISISGIWPFSGFYSKDEVLAAAFSGGHYFIFSVGLLTAFMTAFYMFRLFFLVFTGSMRTKLHPHESPYSMTIPLIILAVLSIAAGWLLVVNHSIEHLIHWKTAESQVETSHIPVILSLCAAVLGIALSFAMYYLKLFDPAKIAERFGFVNKILINKYYIDEFYEIAVIEPLKRTAAFFSKFDPGIIDGGVNFAGWLTVKLSGIQNWFDKYIVDGAVNGTAFVTRISGDFLRKFQTGNVQNYILIITGGIVFILLIKIMIF